MKEDLVFLCLSIFCPIIFFLLGRAIRGKRAKRWMCESLTVLISALILSPIAYCYACVEAQAATCAIFNLIHFFLLLRSEIDCKKEHIIDQSKG